MIAILTGVRWYFIVVLIYISLIMLSIFSYACWLSVCLLWRNVYLGLLPILWLGCLGVLILSCMTCFYMLEIKALSVTSFANIFSHSVVCLFVLLIVSSAVPKLLSLMRSRLFLLLFVLPWETDLRKYCYDLCQKMFCLCSFLGVLWRLILYLGI